MRRIAIGFIVLGLALGFSTVQAGSGSLDDFFAMQIDRKISQRESQARLYASSELKNLNCDGKSAADQAKFYKENKENLIHQMAELEIGERPAKVEYFLIKAYFDFVAHRQRLYACKTGH